MNSGPISSSQRDVGKMETVTDSVFLGSKITADDDGSHKIERYMHTPMFILVLFTIVRIGIKG